MCGKALWAGCFTAFLLVGAARAAFAQQEVYHPGETYDSLQAGQDAYWDAEAQRRALIGRQVLLEEQIMLQNTWANPQDRYRPVRPESYGPISPQAYGGPTLADAYAYPPGSGTVYYRGAGSVSVFQPWPRVPNDIWGTPYYGYVRQPIGHVKIWTSRLGYIYKPIYASPPMAGPPPALAVGPRAAVPLTRRPASGPRTPAGSAASPAAPPPPPPPPPKPAVPAGPRDPNRGEGREPNPPQAGQEI